MRYFRNALSGGLTALLSGRLIQIASVSLLGLFLPIFLYEHLGFNPAYVFAYFLAGYAGYALLLPLGVQVLNRIGLRRSIRFASFAYAGFYACLFFLEYAPMALLILSVVLIITHRILYWIPYHIDFAKFTSTEDRGKSVSIVWASKSFFKVVMPTIAGIIIAAYAFDVLFLLAMSFYVLAIIPFTFLPRTRERYSWSILGTFRRFFAKANRRLVIANMANGAENVVGIVVWPIFIYQILNGEYVQVGAISSGIILVSIVLQLIAGNYTDKLDKRTMLKWSTPLCALGWMAKAFVISAGQIFAIGAYHSLVRIFKNTPFDSLNYEIMADTGHYVDEYTVLKEMAVNLGRTGMLTLAIVAVMVLGLNWTFLLAAFVSLAIGIL